MKGSVIVIEFDLTGSDDAELMCEEKSAWRGSLPDDAETRRSISMIRRQANNERGCQKRRRRT